MDAFVAVTLPAKVEVPKVLAPERRKAALVVLNALPWFWLRKYEALVVEKRSVTLFQ